MDLVRSLAYMTVWAVGFIAVVQITSPFFDKLESAIAGQGA